MKAMMNPLTLGHHFCLHSVLLVCISILIMFSHPKFPLKHSAKYFNFCVRLLGRSAIRLLGCCLPSYLRYGDVIVACEGLQNGNMHMLRAQDS